MATLRDEPYVWVTWITKLMSGEAQCRWAAWFRAHHTFEKQPSDFDSAAWTARHAELLRATSDGLRAEGWELYLEAQNQFRLKGKEGTTLSGKPDLVALRGDEVKVIDCKTGRPKTADQMQVLVYMLVLPHTHAACKGRVVDGEVRYHDHAVAIPAAKITDDLREQFRRTMHEVGGTGPPPRVPSWDECRYCDITARDCPQRVTEAPGETDAGDLF